MRGQDLAEDGVDRDEVKDALFPTICPNNPQQDRLWFKWLMRPSRVEPGPEAEVEAEEEVEAVEAVEAKGTGDRTNHGRHIVRLNSSPPCIDFPADQPLVLALPLVRPSLL